MTKRLWHTMVTDMGPLSNKIPVPIKTFTSYNDAFKHLIVTKQVWEEYPGMKVEEEDSVSFRVTGSFQDARYSLLMKEEFTSVSNLEDSYLLESMRRGIPIYELKADAMTAYMYQQKADGKWGG